MRIPSGVTDQVIYFVAVDSTDGYTRETGLSSFTVYRSRNTTTATAMTTPTVTEVDATNMPGVYTLLLDEDMTIGSGNDSEMMTFHITQASMRPVTVAIELYRPKITAAETLTVSSGVASADMTALSGDSTAADNLEAMYDGTGYTNDAAPATQSQVGNLAVGSGGISITAESFTKAGAEAETNTYTATVAQDGTYHIVEDDAGSTDVYYQFDITPNGVPIDVEWHGYAQSQGDSYGVYFYNWGSTSWEQVDTLSGANGTTPITETFSATVAHVGTGANDGKVRLRFLSADGTAIATDRIVCTYTVIGLDLGYAEAAVWVDETAGTSSGTTPGTDGLVTNRSDDFDNAQTIAEALGYTKLHVTNGNSITLAATINNFTIGIIGGNWTLALGGQDVGGCDINDAIVSGTATGTDPHFHNCIMNTCTLPPCELFRCGVQGTITLGSAGDFRFVDCYSDIPGSSAPIVDMGSAVGATNLFFRRWSGGLTLNNVQSGDVVSVDVVSGGTVTVNGTGGTVVIRGHCNVVDGSSGSVSITQTSVVNMTKINSEVDTAIGDASLATAAAVSTVSGNVDAILLDTAELQGDWTDGGRLDTILDAVLVDTGTSIPATLSGLNDIAASDILTTQLTESYAADGDAPTLTQALLLIQQHLTEFSLSGTTWTTKKLDGSTTAATFTLDDASTPTSITRAS